QRRLSHPALPAPSPPPPVPPDAHFEVSTAAGRESRRALAPRRRREASWAVRRTPTEKRTPRQRADLASRFAPLKSICPGASINCAASSPPSARFGPSFGGGARLPLDAAAVEGTTPSSPRSQRRRLRPSAPALPTGAALAARRDSSPLRLRPRS